MTEPQVIDKLVSFDEDYSDPSGTRLIVKHEQDIPDDYISQLKRDKVDADHAPTGEFMKFASIPLSVVELWDKQGFRIEEHSAHEIVQRLHRDGLDAFVTTNKRI